MNDQSPKKKPAATRVTVTETRFDRFFKWPYYPTNFHGSFDEQWIRFPIVYRWKNLPPRYGGEKLIDFTGMLRNGKAFACEVKQQDINADDGKGRFKYERINERQYNYLNWMHQNGGVAWLGLGFVDGKRPVATFLIPWEQFLYVEKNYLETYLNGTSRPWRSIDEESAGDWWGPFELVHVKPKGRDWAYFTHYEWHIWQTQHLDEPLPRPEPFWHEGMMIG